MILTVTQYLNEMRGSIYITTSLKEEFKKITDKEVNLKMMIVLVES